MTAVSSSSYRSGLETLESEAALVLMNIKSEISPRGSFSHHNVIKDWKGYHNSSDGSQQCPTIKTLFNNQLSDSDDSSAITTPQASVPTIMTTEVYESYLAYNNRPKKEDEEGENGLTLIVCEEGEAMEEA